VDFAHAVIQSYSMPESLFRLPVSDRLRHFALQAQDVSRSRSYVSAQRCLSVGPYSDCAVIRTRCPERVADPSTMPSTFRSRAISGRLLLTPL